MREFSTELCIPEAEWATTVPVIQEIMNNYPYRRLENSSPITVYTGMVAGNPLNFDLTSIGYQDLASIDEVQVMKNINIDELQGALQFMHKEVDSKLYQDRKKTNERHNTKTHNRPFNF